MIIFLYGPDFYRRQEKLKTIIADYKRGHSSFAAEKFDLGSEGELSRLKDFSGGRSLFDDVKLAIVSGGMSLEGAAEKDFIKLLKDNLNTKEVTFLVGADKKPIKNFRFLLEDPVLREEFENLDSSKFRNFLNQQAKQRNLFFDRGSEDLLLSVYAGDSWGLVTELDKLALLNEKKINSAVLKNHLETFSSINIFILIQEFYSSSRPAARLVLLDQLLSQGEDAGKIFNILAAFYGDALWKNRVADYDWAVKSGKMDYEEALLSLAIG